MSATNGLLTTFGYDGDGARLWKLTSTNTLQVWIDGNYEEKNGKILFHILAGRRTVCTFDSTGTNVFEYYHDDLLGSTAIQSDQNGNEIQNFGYTAFGKNRVTQSSTAFPVSRRYTSQVLDDDTGLYYFNFRYYDPQLGRFMQPDDIIPGLSDPQSYNRYAYVRNNPLRHTDPLGHSDENVVYRATSRAESWEQIPNLTAFVALSPAQPTLEQLLAPPPSSPPPQRTASIGPIPTDPNSYSALMPGSPFLGTPLGEQLARANAEAILTAPGAEITLGKLGQVFSSFRSVESEAIAIREGGAYGELTTAGKVRHHMPANAASPLSEGEGPAIRMEPADHMRTASFGNRRPAQAYRARQAELINQGKFNEAQQMDVEDLRSKFGSKYDTGIKQVQDYTKTIPSEKLKPAPSNATGN